MTPISEYGEVGLIQHITKNFPIINADTIKTVGDDAAVIRAAKDKVNVVSTDMLLEGVHFDLSYVPLKHLGYKAVAVNVSDIVAMNAKPYGITVGLAMSNRFPVEAIDELYEGMRLACEKYGIELLGGDTCSSKQGLVLSITALGVGDEDKIVYRNGAKATDLICVTGDLGAAYAGFLVLDREKATYLGNPDLQPDLEPYDYVVKRQLKPEARLKIIEKLAELGVKPTAMIDISDGLASELHHICTQSRCGSTIYADRLPIDPQTASVGEEFKISPVTFAMNGGEDYELLFTLDISHFNAIKDIQEITIIGHITPDVGQMDIVLSPGNIATITAQGWKHF